MLATYHHGETVPDTRPLLIAHGLFGSARNWNVVARTLSAGRAVITVDMRNHAASPWTETHTYPDMAADLAEVIETLDGPVDLLGHSMGGKAAMWLALDQPDLVARLIVADIAPVAYGHSQMQYLEAMRDLPLDTVTTRSAADKQMRESVPDLATRAFLLQSLDVAEKRWRLNLDTLGRDMPAIMAFPESEATYSQPTLFLAGGESDYILPEYRPAMKALFPKGRLVKIPGAHHWLHAEKPREFVAAVTTWLEN